MRSVWQVYIIAMNKSGIELSIGIHSRHWLGLALINL